MPKPTRLSRKADQSSNGKDEMTMLTPAMLPACVCLGGEQVMIMEADEGDGPFIGKYAIRVREKDGTLRRQTRDEELAFSAAPGTRAARDAAIARLTPTLKEDTQLELIALPWKPGDVESVLQQIERSNAAIALH